VNAFSLTDPSPVFLTVIVIVAGNTV